MGDDVHALLGLLKGVKAVPFIVQGDQLDGLGGPCCLGGNYLYHVKLREGSVVSAVLKQHVMIVFLG